MITSRSLLKTYLVEDAKANNRTSIKPNLFGDEIWKFIVNLRKLEYYSNLQGIKRKIYLPLRIIYKFSLHNRSLKLGFSIPVNTFDMGLAIPHYGTIVVARGAHIGKNCRIHECVNIGATNGSSKAAIIGNNVFIGSGAKIIGEVVIADDVAIAANAVVTKSILEKGTTWGGIPAKKISDNNSRSNLSQMLFQNSKQ